MWRFTPVKIWFSTSVLDCEPNGLHCGPITASAIGLISHASDNADSPTYFWSTVADLALFAATCVQLHVFSGAKRWKRLNENASSKSAIIASSDESLDDSNVQPGPGRFVVVTEAISRASKWFESMFRSLYSLSLRLCALHARKATCVSLAVASVTASSSVTVASVTFFLLAFAGLIFSPPPGKTASTYVSPFQRRKKGIGSKAL